MKQLQQIHHVNVRVLSFCHSLSYTNGHCTCAAVAHSSTPTHKCKRAHDYPVLSYELSHCTMCCCSTAVIPHANEPHSVSMAARPVWHSMEYTQIDILGSGMKWLVIWWWWWWWWWTDLCMKWWYDNMERCRRVWHNIQYRKIDELGSGMIGVVCYVRLAKTIYIKLTY